jgi:hypothetical protein
MKKTILLVALFVLAEQYLTAQDVLHYNKQTWVAGLKDGSGKWHHGYLTEINDSTLTISKTRNTLQISPATELEQGRLFGYQDVEKLELNRRGSFGKGALYGGLVGAVICGSFGAFLVTVFKGENGGGLIAAFAVGGAIPGAMIGALIGAIGKNFKINSKKENFTKMRTQMIKALVR